MHLPNEDRATGHLQEAELAWHYTGTYVQVVLNSTQWNPKEGKPWSIHIVLAMVREGLKGTDRKDREELGFV